MPSRQQAAAACSKATPPAGAGTTARPGGRRAAIPFPPTPRAVWWRMAGALSVSNPGFGCQPQSEAAGREAPSAEGSLAANSPEQPARHGGQRELCKHLQWGSAAEELGPSVSQGADNALPQASSPPRQGKGARVLLTRERLHLRRDGGLERFEAAGQLSAYLSKTNRND